MIPWQENIAVPSRVSNLTSWHMAHITSVAVALANETTSVSILMGNALLASVSNAIDAGLLQDKGEPHAEMPFAYAWCEAILRCTSL